MTTLSELLLGMAEGQIPKEIPPGCECRDELQQLCDHLAELARFSGAMAAGDLSATLYRRGALAGSLKGLHANLRHLTWQTQQVAGGDFNQRVEFLGEFSTAFNSMVESLATARDDLITKNEQLATAYRDLKAAEAQLLQKEKMASIGQLAAGIAHEINNPMGFITSNLGTFRNYSNELQQYIRAAESAAAKGPAPEQEALANLRGTLDVEFILEDIAQLLEESLNGAKRVRDIVQTLKDFSRVDESDIQQANVNECLESTLGTLGSQIHAKATIHRDYGDLPLIRSQPRQLNQLFMNLLLNAVQALGNEGEIRIATRTVDAQVVVTIADTGCGIAQENLNRVFEPFFTTRPVGEGTGLGLAMSYDIVRKHHGSIDIASTVGAGTTITVRLPIQSPEADEPGAS